MFRPRNVALVGAVVFTASFGSRRAHAQAPAANDEAIAQSLFDAARGLMDRGDFARACPMFAESQRLDPGGGTLLNLAVCREKEGRLGQAWSHFGDALTQALRDKHANREATARSHIRAIEARVPFVIVRLGQGFPEGARIELDGQPFSRNFASTRVPVDPGTHAIRVIQEGREPLTWQGTFAEGQLKEASFETPSIPILPTIDTIPIPGSGAPVTTMTTNTPTLSSVAPSPPVCPSGSCEASEPANKYRTESSFTGSSKFAFGAAIASGIGSGLFGIVAVNHQKAFEDACVPSRSYCGSSVGISERDQARGFAIASTVTLGLGVALAALGYLLPRSVRVVPSSAQGAQAVTPFRF